MRFTALLVILMLLFSSPACAQTTDYTFTDALGYEVTLSSHERVAALYGSFAETWLLAGGELVGVTSDALEERALDFGDGVAVLGSVKEPNLEEIIIADPDFLILSADIAAHTEFHAALSAAQIPHAYYRVDTFDDYLAMLRQFTALTQREDLYLQNGEAVRLQIEAVLDSVKNKPSPTVLLLRAFSTGVKAKGDDNLAGVILRDLGADNLVSRYESLLEDVSMEAIIAADPDFIFVTVMGSSDEKALAYLNAHFAENPAWAGLSAVKNDRFTVLPKALFHYKPNARWGESYAYLANLLYPELDDENQ